MSTTTPPDKRTKRFPKYPETATPDELEAPAKGNKVYYDDDVKGFGLRITSAGARAFILNYRVAGRERRYTIGSHPDYSVAREEAKRLKQEIGKGLDPLAEKQADREAPTMADLELNFVRKSAFATLP